MIRQKTVAFVLLLLLLLTDRVCFRDPSSQRQLNTKVMENERENKIDSPETLIDTHGFVNKITGCFPFAVLFLFRFLCFPFLRTLFLSHPLLYPSRLRKVCVRLDKQVLTFEREA